MGVNFQKQSALEGQLVVKVSEADFKDSYQKKLKEYAKKASIKGFRPGKVPVPVVQKMVGQSLKAEEVFKIVENEINGYIDSNKLLLVGRPLPAEAENDKTIDWNSQTDFEFTYDIATVPSFGVSVSKKLSFTDYKVVPNDDKIKEIHESMLKRYGSHEHVEEAASNDLIKGNLQKVGSEEDNKLNLWLEKLKTAQQKEFIGKKVKDIVKFDIQKLFSNDEVLIGQFLGISKEEAKEVSGEYEFEITSITRYTDAEVNQEYYDKVFGEGKVNSDKEYKAEIANNVAQSYSQNVEYFLFSEIRKQILKDSKVEISDNFLKRWILEANAEAKLDEIEKDLTKYSDEYKWSLIRNKIIDDNKLEATMDEVKNDAFNRVIRQYMGGSEINDEMRQMFGSYIDKYLKEENGKNYMAHLENVLAGKVMDFLKQNVTLTQKEVSTDEFEKIIEKSL
jgi:trigger factor